MLRTPRGQRAAATLEADDLVAPALLDAEVLSVLRREVLAHRLDLPDARLALDRLLAWRVPRVLHGPYAVRAFERTTALTTRSTSRWRKPTGRRW